MIKSLKIKTKLTNYSIQIGNNIFKKFLNNLKKEKNKKYILIDSKIYKNFQKYFKSIESKEIFLIKINGSEKIKSISAYWKITTNLLNKILDQNFWR